ncbi:MAG: kinase [Alphaproteobacteria bacterium]|nr:kinase [Alphaproteobacteria bacterium]
MDALTILRDWLLPKLDTRPFILGLAGAQGSGKSTLAAALAADLAGRGYRAAAVSIDDFYRSRQHRRALGARVHPLFATRGPPGTHDLPLLLDALARIRAGRPLALPVFDKLADDRLPPQHWRRPGRIDVLILEGWCIGARPQPTALLAHPINALEAEADPAAHWRTHANQALAGQYQRTWAMLDALAFLAAPDWASVPRWRAEQEANIGGPMNAAAITRFCAHYERLTRWQLATTPARAGLMLRLGGQRQLTGSTDGQSGRQRNHGAVANLPEQP